MSTPTLPEDAPTDEQAAPSVEDPAPTAQSEVAEDSVDHGEAPKVVPADRFNGLMGRFNRTQSELERERERVAELEARLNERESNVEEPPAVTAETSELEARVNQLTEMLLTERLENARAAAIQEHPEAAPFADLIVGDSPEDIRDMARLIAERTKAATAPATPPAEGEEQEQETQETAPPAQAEGGETQETTEQTAPPVSGGGAAFSSEASADERVSKAIESGNFSDFLKAKWESQAMRDGADLTVS